MAASNTIANRAERMTTLLFESDLRVCSVLLDRVGLIRVKGLYDSEDKPAYTPSAVTRKIITATIAA